MRTFSLQHSRRGSAILIGLVISTLLAILVISFMERTKYLIESTQGIENSTQAYYYTNTILEETLNTSNIKNKPWDISGTNPEWKKMHFHGDSSKPIVGRVKLLVRGRGNIIPYAGEGTSPNDHDWNIISQKHPLQLVISNKDEIANAQIKLRTPESNGRKMSFLNGNRKGVLQWSFGNKTYILQPQNEGETITYNDLRNANTAINGINIGIRQGKLFTSGKTEPDPNRDIRGLNINCVGYSCAFKMGVMRPILSDTVNKEIIPYLEYQILFDRPVPDQYITFQAIGTKGNYSRKRIVQLQQITTNTALDFAVLQ